MPPASEDRPDTGPPLWSIGLAVALMLGVPMLLYSLAPTGPIREGDTLFSERSVKVMLAHPLLYESAKFDDTCLLDPQDPLMVIQRPSDRSDGMVLVKIQGKTKIEWPFCPPQAEIIVAVHQIAQKPEVFAETRKNFREWWRR